MRFNENRRPLAWLRPVVLSMMRCLPRPKAGDTALSVDKALLPQLESLHHFIVGNNSLLQPIHIATRFVSAGMTGGRDSATPTRRSTDLESVVCFFGETDKINKNMDMTVKTNQCAISTKSSICRAKVGLWEKSTWSAKDGLLSDREIISISLELVLLLTPVPEHTASVNNSGIPRIPTTSASTDRQQ
ncbi:hypothetical protein ON010_g15487 [Phytophthora cinnamomi]|nr:hypothetical protein ON010_g15487 [Phytophthora cinnamomi]